MKVALGIDVGGSATKVAGVRTDKSLISTLRVRAEDQLTSLYGALGNYLKSNHLSLSDVERVVLTGVGSSFVDGDILGLPTYRVDEFSAIGTGGLALSKQSSALVVSMGTGTALLWAGADGKIEHVSSSGVGGGTLVGLCRKLAGVERFDQIKKMAGEGDLRHIDLTIRDISKTPVGNLDLSLTASNFGKLEEDASSTDLVAGVVNMVLQVIGTITVLAAQHCSTKTVVLTGSVTTLPQTQANFQRFGEIHGLKYIIPENATFATAVGAALYSFPE